MTIFKLPDLGEGLQEAEISAWHVAPGDDVDVDQPLLSVETAKAIVEIPSPQAGKIERLFGKPGDILQVGAPLIEFVGKDGESDRRRRPALMRAPSSAAWRRATRSRAKKRPRPDRAHRGESDARRPRARAPARSGSRRRHAERAE